MKCIRGDSIKPVIINRYVMIPPALLTEFSEDQLKIYIGMAQRELESIRGKYYFEMEDALELFITQCHNALNIVSANEKVYQS